jgi:adenylate cyclase class 2
VIEAEIKARLSNPAQVRQRLEQWATGTPETYVDTYFDTPERSLSVRDQELRIRTISGPNGTRHLLTYKGQPVDAVTQSKPEFETLVSDREAAATILTSLGFPAEVAFTKECVNYALDRANRNFLATVVTVPEIEGTFLEVETQAADDDVNAALDAVRHLLGELGVDQTQWTTGTYTDAVRAARDTLMRR